MSNRARCAPLWASLMCVAVICAVCEGKSVKVGIRASWKETSLLAEASEFFASEGRFWEFAEETHSILKSSNQTDGTAVSVIGGPLPSQFSLYEAALTFAQRNAEPHDRAALKAALSLRVHSPAVEMHYQFVKPYLEFSSEITASQCFATASGTSKIFLTPQSLQEYVAGPSCSHASTSEDEVFDFDHVYSSTSGEVCGATVLLYCNIGSQHFIDFHNYLKTSGVGKYVLRHHLPHHFSASDGVTYSRDGSPASTTQAEWAGKVYVQGYCAELQIKDMEYKNMDEKKSGEGSDKQGDDAETGEDTSAREIDDGINFGILEERKPELRDGILSLKEALRQRGDAIKSGEETSDDIKVWKIQALGLQSSVSILKSLDPLDKLMDISQNFPRRVTSLSKLTITDPASSQIVEKINVFPYTSNANPGDSSLHINNRQQDISTLNAFTLLDSIKAESAAIGRVLANLVAYINVTGQKVNANELAAKLLSTPMSTSTMQRNYWGQFVAVGSSMRFKFKLSAVMWVNDIEKDARYVHWPSSVRELLKPAYYGQVRYARKNLFTSIHIIDPTSKEQLSATRVYYKYMLQNAPSKMGVVLVCPEAVKRAQEFQKSEDFEVPLANSNVKLFEGEALMSIGVDASVAVTEVESLGAGGKIYRDTLAARIISIVEFLRRGNKPSDNKDAIEFLTTLHENTKGETVTEEEVRQTLREVTSASWEEATTTAKGKAEVEKSALYVVDKGITTFPTCLFNGLNIKNSDPEDAFIEGIRKEQGYVRELIRDGVITDKTKDVYRAILEHNNAVNRYSNVVFDNLKFAKLSFNAISEAEPQIKFLTESDASQVDITTLIVIDPYSSGGSGLYIQALNHLYNQQNANVKKYKSRLGLVFKGTSVLPNIKAPVLQCAIHALIDATEGRKEQISTLLQFGVSVRQALVKLNGKTVPESGFQLLVEHIIAKFNALNSVAPNDKGDNIYKKKQELAISFDEVLFSKEFSGCLAARPFFHHSSITSHLNLDRLDSAVITNGRLVTISEDTPFLSEDLSGLEAFEYAQRAQSLTKALRSAGAWPPETAPSGQRQAAATVLVSLVGTLASDWFTFGERMREVLPPLKVSEGNAFVVKSSEETLIDIVAVLDPLSSEAQKVSGLLHALRTAFPIKITVYLNPIPQLSSMPLKSFFRCVMQPHLSFDSRKAIIPPAALFNSLPDSKVLTLTMHEPEPWVIIQTYAPYDLDNIQLEVIDRSTLYSEFELENIVVTGSCIDAGTGQPPRGLELGMLSAINSEVSRDTLVMSNYGYFQLKGNPGVWKLSLKKGSRSEDLFQISTTASVDPNGPTALFSPKIVTVTNVVAKSFMGEQLYLKVLKKPGKETEELLSDGKDDDKEDSNLWQSLSSLLGDKKKKNNNAPATAKKIGEPTLHIFSVATGHLYERFLKIMFTTVLNNTYSTDNARVKFWILGNFLSPQFRRFLPHMAKEWNFDFEFVTYKWPNWLRKQTEKQRIIWAYKILFLDVLFPLSLDKVIFVDSDQIVRTDLHELYNMDLKGAPLAYTPFCDSRKETEGFRFWKSGFWKDHLRGKPYHISALYVVDIKRLRKMAAGDQLRMVYDNLSQDPNSLANLDQDLPNYTQNMIPIFSLPQEWLWCETWCSDSTKISARTIDLCNNPLTKRPKLENARRVIPEWNSYDEKIANFEKSLKLEV